MASAPEVAPLRLFYSYSREDEALRAALETHLKLLVRQGLIEPWDDRMIEVGHEWEPAILESLERADIILLLVSPDFVRSDHIWNKEMDRAMARHAEGTARVIPILLRPTDLTGAPFMKLQALPRDLNPVVKWRDRDEALTNVAQGIRAVAEKMQKERPRAPAPPPAVAPASPPPARSAAPEPPFAPGLRRLIDDFLFGDDFDAFCSSYFPLVKRRFTSGMQQVAKATLLMDHADHRLILEGLRDAYPAEVAAREHLLRPR